MTVFRRPTKLATTIPKPTIIIGTPMTAPKIVKHNRSPTNTRIIPKILMRITVFLLLPECS
jgi:hypothetical protein